MEQAGGFECVGSCEIDKYAAAAYKAMYNTEKEVYYSDVTRIDTGEMPDFDLLTGGFPCQSYPEKKNIPKLTKKTHKQSVMPSKLRDNIHALLIKILANF